MVLSTVRLLSGFILAPDESRRSWTFFWIPFTSNPLRGTTLSLLLTVPNADTDGAWRHESWGVPSLVKVHTVKAAYYGFLVVPLLDHELYVRVFLCGRLEVIEEEGASVR